jgi:tetratricopeptide (TPR) repeat protein
LSNTLELSKRAEKLETQGNWLEAGQLFERAGQGDRAISAFKRAGEVDRAAAIYEKAEAWEDAAKIYSSLGNHRKALQLFTQAGNHAKVAELRQNVPALDAPPAPAPSAAADAAEGVLALDPNLEVGAQQYLESGQVVDAVVARLRKGDADGACALYENCQEDIGYNVLAAVAGDPEVEKHAAEMFYLARAVREAGGHQRQAGAQALPLLRAHPGAQAALHIRHAGIIARPDRLSRGRVPGPWTRWSCCASTC